MLTLYLFITKVDTFKYLQHGFMSKQRQQKVMDIKSIFDV